jgi:hypothetical protein
MRESSKNLKVKQENVLEAQKKWNFEEEETNGCKMDQNNGM